MTVLARRAAAEPGNILIRTTAGDLCGRDIHRHVEIDYQGRRITGTLSRVWTDITEVVALHVVGDTGWHPYMTIKVGIEHPVAVGGRS